MKVINLSGYRRIGSPSEFRGQIRKGDDYYEYCCIPDYEVKYEGYHCESIELQDVFVNLMELKERTLMVSIIFPNTYDMEKIVDWLSMYYVSFNERDNHGYFIAGSEEIIEGVRYRGQPILLCARRPEKVYYDETVLEEVTESYIRQHRIINTGNFEIISMNNDTRSTNENSLDKKDLNELDNGLNGLDKDDSLNNWLNNDVDVAVSKVDTGDMDSLELVPYYRVYETKSKGIYFKVTVAADDPVELEDKRVFTYAKDFASKRGYWIFMTSGEVKVYGQNEVCRRSFQFAGRKEDVYRAMVDKRKRCELCKGMQNPSKIYGGKFDTDEIGPWSDWRGNLDARVMVIGQDWGDVSAFIKSEGRCDLSNDTNRNLVELLKIVGVSEKYPLFFTNAILCMKEGIGLSADTNKEWYRNCGEHFLKALIELIEPRIVITLGEEAYFTLARLFGFPKGKLKARVEEREPIELCEGTKLFAFYHCGRKSLNLNRKWEEQVKDWEQIKGYL